MSMIRWLVEQTGLKTDWGINLGRVRCPRCGVRQPIVRSPRNERQRLWGGYTCRVCGCEMDKWGRQIAT